MRDLFLFGHWHRNSIQFSILKILFGVSVFEICFQVLFKLSSLLGWPKSLSPISKGKNSNVQKNNLQICSFVLIMLYFTLSFNFTLPTRVILFFLWLLVSQKKYGESVNDVIFFVKTLSQMTTSKSKIMNRSHRKKKRENM